MNSAYHEQQGSRRPEGSMQEAVMLMQPTEGVDGKKRHCRAVKQGHALQIRPVHNAATWQACLSTLAAATPFHHWDWLQIMSAALGNHFLRLGFYKDGALIGLAPLLVKQVGFYTNANWTPFPYLGPLVPEALTWEALVALDRYQRRNGISLMQLGFAPHAGVDADLLRAAGYAVRMDTTMAVELAGAGEAVLMARMTAKRRSRIRRAQRAGIIVRPAREEEIRAELNTLLHDVFARQGLPSPYPETTTGLVWERYRDDPDARLTTACYEGKPVAFSISLADGVRAYNWQAAGSHHLRQLNAMTLLYWEDILWASARGYQAFDLVGSPNPGIGEYKRQFGATEISYPVATRENSRLAVWARGAYGRIRELRVRDVGKGQTDENAE